MPTDGDAKFRLMFERSADAILLLDTSINKFVEYNQAALDMLRCSREELSALHPSELSPPLQPDGRSSYEAANQRIAAAVRLGSNRFEWIHRSPHRDDFPVEVLLTPIQVGSAPMVLVVWRDITERKRDEQALRQAQKMESLGVLAGGLAHDFNNLLTALSGNLTLARTHVAPDHPAAPHLEQMNRVVAKAAELSRQMLTYSGLGALSVEPVDLDQLVREMAELLEAGLGAGVRLICETSGTQAVVEANRVELQQIIMNLVTNAAEASAPHSAVVVRTRLVDLDEAALAQQVPGQSLQPGRHVVLDVVDEGTGMSPQVLDRIFDPFYSTKGTGRGLGLSVIQGIVRSYRGGIRLHSRLGLGTTFTVYFPASRQPPTPRVEAPVAQGLETGAKASGLVLLVDDHVSVRRSTRALLEVMGFTVLEAADGRTALALHRQHQDELSWVLMDLTMPEMDGHQVFLEMRKLDPLVKVVLSSGWAESELAARFRSAPPSAFLSKPYRDTELEALARRLGLWSAKKEHGAARH